MKTTKVLLLGAVVTAFTFTSFAADALLSPRAAGNQIKQFAGTYNDIDLVAANNTGFLSPRAAGNQIRTVAGTYNEVTPALICYQNMGGTPKAVAECAAHTTMPGCQTMTVAPLK